MKKQKYQFNEIVRACDCGSGNLRYFYGVYPERGFHEYLCCDWIMCESDFKAKVWRDEILQSKIMKENESNAS